MYINLELQIYTEIHFQLQIQGKIKFQKELYIPIIFNRPSVRESNSEVA